MGPYFIKNIFSLKAVYHLRQTFLRKERSRLKAVTIFVEKLPIRCSECAFDVCLQNSSEKYLKNLGKAPAVEALFQAQL